MTAKTIRPTITHISIAMPNISFLLYGHFVSVSTKS
jgi:hypothetical protein